MNETEFTYRVRQALNEGVEKLDYKTQLRLEAARKAALAKHRAAAQPSVWVPAMQRTATARAPEDTRDGLWSWLRGVGMAVPVVALLAGFIGIYQWQREQAIAEMANLDFAVLLDEVPVDTYADQGFSVLLTNETLQN
jgi:hypothetical protein